MSTQQPRGLPALAAGLLGLQALVVLLALPTLAVLGLRGAAPYALVGALAGVLLAAAAVQRRRVGPPVGTACELATLAVGALVWPLLVLGAVFGGLWVYYLALRRRFAGAGARAAGG